jgi:GTP-binding protein YchF
MTGKTSLFTILTGVHESARVGSMETRVGISKVPDPRLGALAGIFDPPKITHAVVEYVDFPAISKEALRDPQYLASLRVVDALAHVLRVFEDPTVPHEKGSVDAIRDRDDVDLELILSDLMVVEKRMERVDKDRKKHLESDRPLREMPISEDDEKRLRGFQFVSLKPMLYVINAGEESAANLKELEESYKAKLGEKPHTFVTAVCGKIEAELAELTPEEASEMMASYGLTEPGLNRIITATYALLGLMSFLTAGETEVRAWTIPTHSTAVKAAGAIHSDFEKKFIRAEVVNWKNLVDLKGYPGVREKGMLRLEGKEYIVKDGDVLVIRHG